VSDPFDPAAAQTQAPSEFSDRPLTQQQQRRVMLLVIGVLLGVFLLVALVPTVLTAIFGEPDWGAPNQKFSLPSPSGRHRLTMTVAQNTEGADVWKLAIWSADGRPSYADENSALNARGKIYWIWDSSDRVWLYNSEDGSVYFWELLDGAWVKTQWGSRSRKAIGRDVDPPDALFPPKP
jgi:hypothetical protein